MPETRETVRKVVCVLCDGGGRVPPLLAAVYGRSGTVCPSCDGKGTVRAVLTRDYRPPEEDHDD